jgi:biotin transport system substrate-specific component
MTAGYACIFACGTIWLAPFTGWFNVIAMGLLPFLPGMVVKIALATVLLPAGWKLLATFNPNPNSTCVK